jgi:hypothetical protein
MVCGKKEGGEGIEGDEEREKDVGLCCAYITDSAKRTVRKAWQVW